MPREHKHYEIKAARKAHAGSPVASTVLVTREDGQRGYCYIRFSDSFVIAIGKALPRGVSLCDPAYVEVVYRAGQWEVWALYLASGKGKMLWKASTRPNWLTFHQDKNDVADRSARKTQRADPARTRSSPGASTDATAPHSDRRSAQGRASQQSLCAA